MVPLGSPSQLIPRVPVPPDPSLITGLVRQPAIPIFYCPYELTGIASVRHIPWIDLPGGD